MERFTAPFTEPFTAPFTDPVTEICTESPTAPFPELLAELCREARSDGAARGEPRVVLVDGNSACHATARAIFDDTPWHPLLASDALDGLCAVVEQAPAAVLLDEACAPLDPWQFSLLVKSHPRFGAVRIIVLCKRVDVILRARAKAALVDALLQKPFASDEVLALLRGAPACKV